MNQKTSSSGIGFCGILAIVFIVLKLTGNIAWSWWWVLGPLWIPPAVFFSVLAMIAVVVFMVGFLAELTRENK